MCTSPIKIKNPYYGLGNKGINYLRDTLNTYIYVPCGHCSACVSMRQSFVNQRVQMETLRSYPFMLTLTYNSEAIPHIDIGEYHLKFPLYSDVQNMLKRIRKLCPDRPLRYYFVSEYGTNFHRPHFHALIFLEKKDTDTVYTPLNLERTYWTIFLKEWRRRVSLSTKFSRWMNLCTYKRDIYGRRTYDFHYVVPIQGHDNDCSFYVSKYLVNYDEYIGKLLSKIQLDPALSESDTKLLMSCVKPRSCASKDLGSWRYPPINEYIKKCVDATPVSDLIQYVDINTGSKFLLAPYYRRHFETVERREALFLKFYDKRFPLTLFLDEDKPLIDINLRASSSILAEKRFKKVKKSCKDKYF